MYEVLPKLSKWKQLKQTSNNTKEIELVVLVISNTFNYA